MTGTEVGAALVGTVTGAVLGALEEDGITGASGLSNDGGATGIVVGRNEEGEALVGTTDDAGAVVTELEGVPEV